MSIGESAVRFNRKPCSIQRAEDFNLRGWQKWQAAVGAFLAANIPVYEMYDDNPIGALGMVQVELPQKKLQNNEVVCISLATKNSHLNTVLEKLRGRNVEILTFALSSPPKRTITGTRMSYKMHMAGDLNQYL